MTLSESTLRELRLERNRLEAARAEIDRKLAGINVLLEDEAVEPREPVARESQKEDASFVGRVRRALQSLKGSGTAVQIAKMLEADGVQAPGKTPLHVLVSSELWRMSQKPRYGVHKVSYGLYAMRNGD